MPAKKHFDTKLIWRLVNNIDKANISVNEFSELFTFLFPTINHLAFVSDKPLDRKETVLKAASDILKPELIKQLPEIADYPTAIEAIRVLGETVSIKEVMLTNEDKVKLGLQPD
jgi:hypothetical protein